MFMPHKIGQRKSNYKQNQRSTRKDKKIYYFIFRIFFKHENLVIDNQITFPEHNSG